MVMSLILLRPIGCLCVLTLLPWLSMAAAATTSECAILATGAASDLAIDDPKRFEYLTQSCGNERPAPSIAPRATPSAQVVQKQGKPTQKAGGPSKPNALQSVSDSPATDDEKEGCTYRVYPVKNLKHPIGMKACLNGKLIICKKNPEGGVHWEDSFASCSGEDVIDIKTREFNTKEMFLQRDKLKIFEE
jgi:hypothetical protein